MKKKPEQYTRQGKANKNIKNFLSNLKENDIHFEDNQITQCVFLGVLRLKPVPSVFTSNNLPSIVVENKSKRFRNNNSAKEVNKNISTKKDLNKVISGKIRKKNPDRIKASVKKLPTKKPVINIKFNMNKNKKSNTKETVTTIQDSLTKITPQSMLQNKTITLNPIVPTFNPVQNLFDKLKQQMDDKYNRPGCSDVTKETLFSSESNLDQKGSRKSKKPTKKKPIFERLVMPLLTSNTINDNGYHSSTSSINTKSSDEVIVISEENCCTDDEEEVLLNSGPMPNFVLCNSIDNIDDVILINDNSNRSTPDLVISDTRSTRTSPRLNRNDQNLQKTVTNNNQETTTDCNVINTAEDNTEMAISSMINSSDKPRKRRTLLPTIPLNFFNSSMLLRSELAQKKGGGALESRSSLRATTSKMPKLDARQEKSPVKQRKDKLRSSTENLIYEVVKSSTAIPDNSSTVNNGTTDNDVILVEGSPPKVEPLIIKLKVSQNKNTNEKSGQSNGYIDNRNKSQKPEVAKITKNLFFPRHLRSDVNQQKPNEDLSANKSEIMSQPSRKTPIKLNLLKDNSEQIPRSENQATCVQNGSETKEKSVEKVSSNNKKTEKIPDHIRRQLRSVVQENIVNTETSAVILIEDNSKAPTRKSDAEKPVIQKPARAQKKTVEAEIIDLSKTTPKQEISVGENPEADQTVPRQLRSTQTQKIIEEIQEKPKITCKSKDVVLKQNSDEAQKPSDDVKVINVAQFYSPTEKSKTKQSVPQKKIILEKNQDGSNTDQSNKKNTVARRSLRSDLTQKEPIDSEIVKVDQKVSTSTPTPDKSKKESPNLKAVEKDSPKPKNVDVETPIRRQLRSDLPQKEAEPIKAKTPKFSDPESLKSRKSVSRYENLDIDLIDYANMSVDTATPRQLRSDVAQKKKDDIDTQEKLPEGLKKDEAQKTSDSEKTNEMDMNTEVLKRNRSVSKTRASKSAEKSAEVACNNIKKKEDEKSNNIQKIDENVTKNDKNQLAKDEASIKVEKDEATVDLTDFSQTKYLQSVANNRKQQKNRSVSKTRASKLTQIATVTVDDKNKEKSFKNGVKKVNTMKNKIKNIKTLVKQTRKASPATQNNQNVQRNATKNSKNNKTQLSNKKVVKEQKVTVKIENEQNVDLTDSQETTKGKSVPQKSKNVQTTVQSDNKSKKNLNGKQNQNMKKTNAKMQVLGKISKRCTRIRPDPKLTKNSSVQNNKSTQKKQDLDEISVVPEKTSKKQLRTLRSNCVPIVVKEEILKEKPAAIVEKVVVLIHSEPKPKNADEPREKKPEKSVIKEKVKPRILRSQNFNQIDTINEIKEEPARKEANKKSKNGTNKGISQKSKTITKNKKVTVPKKLRSDVKTKKEKPKITKKEKKNVKADGRSKLEKLTKTSKKNIIQQVKSKLKASKSGNPLKKPVNKQKPITKRKKVINWQSNDIIERIIQELKNTIFNQDTTENKTDQEVNKNLVLKKIKKSRKILKKGNLATSATKKKIILAKKKLQQTKAALQRKLRSARKTESTESEANTSGSSDSKENNPPPTTDDDVSQNKTELSEEPVKEETTVHLVDSYLEEISEKNSTNKASDSIIIINDVVVQSSSKVVEKNLKRKSEDSFEVTKTKRRQYTNTVDLTSNISKKNDITVFDFDESEPELEPLRHKTTPNEKSKELKSTETHNTPVEKEIAPRLSSIPKKKPAETIGAQNKEKCIFTQPDYDVIFVEKDATPIKSERIASSIPSTSKIVEVDKDRLLIINDDTDDDLKRNPFTKKPKILVPAFDDEGKPRKLWSVIDTLQSIEPTTPVPVLNIPNIKRTFSTVSSGKSPEEFNSDDKKSPLKQTTIIEMFSKAWNKRNSAKLDIFSSMPPPSSPKLEPVRNSPLYTTLDAPSPRRDRMDDDDSDNESRVEWIPEEYAEYKLKYSVQKMMQYKPLYKCKICQIMMPTYYKLLKHKKEHDNQERPHICAQCGSEFKEVEDFSAHLRVHKGKHPYMCKRCLMGFSTKKAYEAHAPVHIAKSAKIPVKKFRCNVCQKEFAKSMYLERHNRIHTGEKPFKCTICDKNFVQPSNLSTHMLKHLKIKPFICEICNLRFERKDILKRHILTHSAEKPIKCTICNKGFIRQGQLQQHLRMKHSKEMTEPYIEIKVVEEDEHILSHSVKKCDTEKTDLSDHLIMAPLHIKPFVCELCNEHFERKHLFRQHILLHSMRKPVNCSVCNKLYMRESSLRYHMNLKHREKSFIPLIELKDEESIEDFFNENLPFA